MTFEDPALQAVAHVRRVAHQGLTYKEVHPNGVLTDAGMLEDDPMLGSPGKVPPGDKKGKPTALSEEAQLVKLQQYIQKKGAAPTFPSRYPTPFLSVLGA